MFHVALDKSARDRGWVSDETRLRLKNGKEIIFLAFVGEKRVLAREAEWPMTNFYELEEIS